MQLNSMLTLIQTALPADFDINLLTLAEQSQYWQSQPREALAHALRTCPYLDWDSYLARNPDLSLLDMEPVEHFLKHGVFEGRKLEVFSTLPDPSLPGAVRPKVSVIIPNHNKAEYIKKSVGSVLNQSLRNIEIIVVDDASDDGSLELLETMAAADSRMKVISFKERKFTHMARKTGVLASAGRSVMFLDSDDYYVPTACETAYTALSRGYDFVAFNSYVLSGPASDAAQDQQQTLYLQSGAAREYIGPQIINQIYDNRNLPRNLWNKIYEGEHCRRIFRDMPDGSFAPSEDVLEALALIATSRRAAKINDFLYVYRSNVGISTADQSEAKTLLLAKTGEILKPLRELLNRQGLSYLNEKLSFNFLKLARSQFLEYAPPQLITHFFNHLAKYCGLVELIVNFCKMGGKTWELAARQFRHYQIESLPCNPKNIGILYRRLGRGGAEKVAADQIRLLHGLGYKISVFLETAEETDMTLPKDIQVYYIGKNPEAIEDFAANLRALDRAIFQSGIEVMLIHVTYIKTLLWYLMLIRGRHIPALLFSHEDFYFTLLHPWTRGVNDRRIAALACGDKLAVLSRYNELYCRNSGLDAQYIPNPVHLPTAGESINTDFKLRKNNIVVFCRLGDETKNVEDCLRTLSEIIPVEPNVKLTFVGSFANDKNEKKFYTQVAQLRLRNYIHVTGWMEDARAFIDNACLLLSCAYHEAFPLSIAEAQGRGLPCVMYDLPIMIAEDNPGIIRVPTGNYQAAAQAIIKIMSQPLLWEQMSASARKHAQQYTLSSYGERVDRLINNFGSQTPVTYYKPEDYRTVMRHLAFYGAHLPPWVKKI